MTRTKFEDIFLKICNKYNVKVYFNDPTQEEDNGYAQWNEVHLARKYSSTSIYMAVAFHELSHAIINMKRANNVKLYKDHSDFNNEFNAWWLAQRLYAKYNGRINYGGHAVVIVGADTEGVYIANSWGQS